MHLQQNYGRSKVVQKIIINVITRLDNILIVNKRESF